MPPTELSHRIRRVRGLKLAALTSLVCKAGNILLQIVAIPMALVVLGREDFGVFATVSSLIGFIILSDLGVGPGLTNLLAKKIASDDADGAGKAFSTAFFMVGALATIGVAIVIGVVLIFPAETLFGANYSSYQQPIQQGVIVGSVIVLIRLLSSLGDRARAAYQETYINNLFGAGGNVVGGLALIIGVHYYPTIWFLILAVHGSVALASAANLIHLLWKRTHLLPWLRLFQTETAKFFFRDGLAFCATMSLAPLTKDLGIRLILGRLGGPGSVADFDILERIMIFSYGFVVMFTLPLWPAISDAAARRDLEWIQGIRGKLYRYAMLYVAAIMIGLTLLGPWAIQIWLRGEVELSHWVFFCFSIYFGVSIWHHIHHIFLAGLDAIRTVALVVCLELPLVLIGAYVGYSSYQLHGLLVGVALAGCISCWVYPWITSKLITTLRSDWEPLDVEPESASLCAN